MPDRRTLFGAIVAGIAGLLGWRMLSGETETGIVRVDTRSGTVLHCVANGCYTVVRRGQSLLNQSERQKAREKAYGDGAPPAQKALPAPQSAPAEQPAQPVQPAQPEPASQR